MCDAAGIILVYLPPYSPDLNPIEESFAELKAWIKKNNGLVVAYDDFGIFLDLAIQQLNENSSHAAGHFRNVQIGLE